MSVQRVFIVRHGETDYNLEHRWQGWLNIPLNCNGKQQAQALASYMENEAIDGIYSSDLQRAFDTVAEIAKRKNLNILPDRRLREVNLGIFQGLTRTQIDEKYPVERQKWDVEDDFVLPQGESRSQVQARALEAWHDITNQADMKNILIASHGGTIRMLFLKLFPQNAAKIRFGNTSLSIVERTTQGTWHLSAINITPHIT